MIIGSISSVISATVFAHADEVGTKDVFGSIVSPVVQPLLDGAEIDGIGDDIGVIGDG